MKDISSPDPRAGDRVPVPLVRLLTGEIAVGTVINIAFNLFFTWLIFYGSRTVGRDAVLLDVLPATIVPAFMMTFPVTFLMRKRIANGLRVVPKARLPVRVPRPLLLRSPAVALLALALVAAPVVLLLWISWGNDWTWPGLIAFKLGFSAVHAAIVTPIVVLAALELDRKA